MVKGGIEVETTSRGVLLDRKLAIIP
jgi:hypothetical protein